MDSQLKRISQIALGFGYWGIFGLALWWTGLSYQHLANLGQRIGIHAICPDTVSTAGLGPVPSRVSPSPACDGEAWGADSAPSSSHLGLAH